MFRSRLAAALVAAALSATPAADAFPGQPVESPNHLYLEGPDIEPWTLPDAVIDVVHDARWECSEMPVGREFRAPRSPDRSPWDRIILQVESIPTGDPWDRLLIATVGDAEVLRATTPRTRMTLRKDITAFASLLPQGELVEASLSIGSYVGSMEGRMRLEFYDDEPTSQYVVPAATRVVSPLHARHIRYTAAQQPVVDAVVDFGKAVPSKAAIDLTTSGHGSEEFWFQQGPLVSVSERRITRTREFRILVDGTQVGKVVAMPYLYAFLGTGNQRANTPCAGPGSSREGDMLHPLMWWTAQRELDRHGVHANSGEIPQYRIEIKDPAILALLSGERTVTVAIDNVHTAGTWITSLSVLLD